MEEAQASQEIYERTPTLPFEEEDATEESHEQSEPSPELSFEKQDSKDRPAPSAEPSPKKRENKDQSAPSPKISEAPDQTPEDQQRAEAYEQTPTLPFEERCVTQGNKKQRSASPELSELSSSVTEIASEAENDESPLRLFVTLLTEKLLKECNVHHSCCSHTWFSYTRRLTDLTMGGLTLTEGFCPSKKNVGPICQAVLKDLQKTFWSKQQLDALILLGHPAVDGVVVQCLQAHIRSMSAQLAKEARNPHCFWRYGPPLAVFAMVVGILWLLVIFVDS